MLEINEKIRDVIAVVGCRPILQLAFCMLISVCYFLPFSIGVCMASHSDGV